MKKILITGAGSYIGTSFENYVNINFSDKYTVHTVDTIDGTWKNSDFSDIWWVGDTAGGGLVAVRLKNALSEKGLELQSSKNSKGSLTVELKGHVSVNAQDETPMEFYSAV